MIDSLCLDSQDIHYYALRADQQDNGYLQEIVRTCQSNLKKSKHYYTISSILQELGGYYCDLQVHKHVKREERERRLQNWFYEHQNKVPQMEWYEFSACSGSTLGIFCLVAYSFYPELTIEQIQQIR